ncbi:MAG: WG repeat-containing protein [Opitutaceae bacterium]|nr:WG repeat-containing protein [Cephaloticoccus sp.]MCP5530086.1 WG repeat-containing protein [Opitutaceae bacterium]
MKTLRSLTGLLVLFTLGAAVLPAQDTSPGAADFQSALLALSNVDPDAAGPAMRKAAEAGHIEAMVQLAGLHTQGYGVEKSDPEAMRWYGRAAAQGHGAAAQKLQTMLDAGLGNPDEHAALRQQLGTAPVNSTPKPAAVAKSTPATKAAASNPSIPRTAAIIKRDGKFGIMNADRQITISPRYDEAFNDGDSGLIRVRLGNKWGLVDENGREITAPAYDSMAKFQKGVFVVTANGKKGVVDHTGREIIAPRFDSIFTSSDPNTFAAMQAGKLVYIDRQGREKPAVASTPKTTVRPSPPPVEPIATQSAATGFQSFEMFPGDLRRNLPGHWKLVGIMRANPNPQPMTVRFTGPNGTVDTLVANPLSPNPRHYSAQIKEVNDTRRRGTWLQVHFNYGELRFVGQSRDGDLHGTIFTASGGEIGSWTAHKQLDLDYLALAEQARRAKNPEAALHYFGEAIRKNRSADNYVRRGSFHYASQDNGSAIADYSAALERDSHHIGARYNRMLSFYYAQQHAEALIDADTLLARRTNPLSNKQLAFVHHFRGDILTWLERPDEAEQAYTKAIALDPKLAERNRAANTREWVLAQRLKRDLEVARIMNQMNRNITKSADKLREANATASGQEEAEPSPDNQPQTK